MRHYQISLRLIKSVPVWGWWGNTQTFVSCRFLLCFQSITADLGSAPGFTESLSFQSAMLSQRRDSDQLWSLMRTVMRNASHQWGIVSRSPHVSPGFQALMTPSIVETLQQKGSWLSPSARPVPVGSDLSLPADLTHTHTSVCGVRVLFGGFSLFLDSALIDRKL